MNNSQKTPSPNTSPAGSQNPLKVWLICTGVGIMNRGIESFFRECFDGLHPHAAAAGIQLELLKGRGAEGIDEHRVWCLPRTGIAARLLGRAIGRNGYVVEQLSSVLAITRRIRRYQPQVILYSDVNLAMRLHRHRQRMDVPFRLVYSNGAPMKPPFTNCDHVQQVTPFYLDMALAAGEDPRRHSMVPYGFTIPSGTADFDAGFRVEIRQRLGLPTDRKIVLSVGWISATLKRMDYLIDEAASLPQPRPYLVLLGAMDETSPPILEQARAKLGSENFVARSVPYEDVFRYYQAADVFALASLTEGFGRVYVEASMHGLPCAANDQAVMRYVLGDEGTFGDFSKTGALAEILTRLLNEPLDPAIMARRREAMRKRFAWESLAPAYFEMFRAAAAPLTKPSSYVGRA